MSVHKNVSFLSLPYRGHYNHILCALCIYLMAQKDSFQAIFLLTIPSFESHKAFPEVVFWTRAYVYVYQLLHDFGTLPPCSPTEFVLLLFFGEGK